MPPIGDLLGLLALAAAGLAIWLARRRNTARVAAAMATARNEAYAAGEAAVYARIGNTVVVNNSNVGDGRGAIHATRNDYDHDDYDNGAAAYHDDTRGLDHDRAARILDAERGRAIGRVAGFDRPNRNFDGVPVGLHADDRGGVAHADSAEEMKPW